MVNDEVIEGALSPLLAGADHVDVKTVSGPGTLREFVARMMAYDPWWLRTLFAIRTLLAVLLGLRGGVPRVPRWRPEEVPMTPGSPASFFTVRLAEPERVWAADVDDSHLRAALAVVHEADRFHVVTIVHYKRWTGPLYFNLIRPFHHLVVWRMARAGLRRQAA